MATTFTIAVILARELQSTSLCSGIGPVRRLERHTGHK
jgi:hypothetical protein